MADENNGGNAGVDSIELATELTIAWLGNSNTRASADDVPAFLRQMHVALSELSSGGPAQAADAPAAEQSYTPAVSPRTSVKPDHIVSLIDGKKYKTLKRHLSGHGLTPDDYRQRYGLKKDYPMVAPAYSALRREAAQKIGLGGRKKAGSAGTGADAASSEPAPNANAAPAKQPRKRLKVAAPKADNA